VLTDRPPRKKTLLTKFAESDQLSGLELPGDDRLRLTAMSIESVMKDGTRAASIDVDDSGRILNV
jgi:hypothetical protein